MTVQDELKLSYYHQIGVLNQDHGVFLVQHIQTGQVFVKKLLKEYNADVYRYLKENPVPHTASIIEVIEDQDVLIVIEQYLSGQTLENYLESKGVLDPDVAVSIIRQLAAIVGALHGAQPPIIHRDIKPSNVIIGQDGTVSLLDMNAAKWQNNTETEDTRLIGTVGYAAPEQYGFGTSRRQTDVYALGILLNMMLTRDYPKNRLADGYLGAVVDKCTRIDPADRFKDTDALLEALKPSRDTADIPDRKRRIDIRAYALPGFRAGKFRFMIPAALWYLLITVMGITLKVETSSVLDLWINRIAFLIMLLSVTLFSGNYRNIWHRVHVDRIPNLPLRICAVIALDALICFLIVFVLVLIEQVIV